MAGGPRKWGIPYHGSKSRIAPWVIDHLPPSHTLVDLFAGGCAVTHCALKSGKFGRVVANDVSEAPNVFAWACCGGYKGYDFVPTRSEFYEARDGNFVMALLYSFGNNCRDYLWSPEIEGCKVEASRMLTAHGLHERRMHYMAFLRELKKYLDGQGLERLERLEGLKRLEGPEGLERLRITHLDYTEVDVPDGATVYADPPYRGTQQRGYGDGFNSGAFDEWLAEVPFPVVVSEYAAPAGCVEVARTERCQTMCAKTNTTQTERLFVQERFAAEYAGRMGMLDVSAGGQR